MKNPSPPPTHRGLKTAIGAAIVTALGVSLLAPMAHASDVSAVPIIDTNLAPATLNIYKYGMPQTGQPNDGTAQSITNQPPISGVTFTITPVLYNSQTIDLTTPAGWQAAYPTWSSAPDPITQAALSAIGMTLDTANAVTCVTNSSGLCVLPSGSAPTFPLSLYYVTESIAAGTQTNPTGVEPNPDPFLVTLPMTNSAGNGWITDATTGNYAVWVYPKNVINVPNKAVDSSKAYSVGGTVVYTIDSALILDASGDVYTKYIVEDPIDNRLNVQSVAVFFTDPTGVNADIPVPASNYTVSPSLPTSPAASAVPGTDLTVTFNSPTGLAFIAAQAQINWNSNASANTGWQLKTVVTTTINNNLDTADTVDAGLIPNTARVYVNNDDQGVPTDTVQTYFGGVALHKQDGKSSAPLNGAVFQIFASSSDAVAKTNPLTALTVNQQSATEFTSGDTTQGNTSGMVGILGLHYNSQGVGDATTPACSLPDAVNFPDSDYSGPTVTGNTYWVVETQAPDTYSLQSDPIAVCVVGVLDGSTTTDSTDDWWVDNTPINAGFDLPFTAWVGDHTAIVAVALLVSGLAIYEVRRRRAHVAA